MNIIRKLLFIEYDDKTILVLEFDNFFKNIIRNSGKINSLKN